MIGSDVVWLCDCFLCRFFVKPLLKMLYKSRFCSSGVRGMVESSSGVVEEESKKELSQLVKALREAVIELREALGDLSNPLNQVVVSKPEEVINTQAGDVARSTGNDDGNPPTEKGRSELGSLSEIRKTLKKTSAESRYVDVKILMKFMRLVNLLLDRVDKDLLIHYITFMNKLKLIKDEELELLKVVIDLVDEGRKRSLSVDEQIAVFSIIAENFGLKDELVDTELMTYVLKLIVSK